MRSAYDQKTVRTDTEGRGPKLSRVGKGIPDGYLAFGFGAKINILGATNESCLSEKSRLMFLVLD